MFLVLRKSRLSVLAVASIAGLVVFRFVLDSSVRNMPPPVPAATGIPAGPVRVKAVEPGFAENKDMQPASASAAIATVCGDNPPTADRYEARNDALRAIARERNLASNDVAALMDYLASTNDMLHTERLAALKNDVMNLLPNQEPPPEI